MSDHRAILTANAPAPVGPYSQAIRVDGFVFCSGQVGLDPATGKIIDGGVGAQARQVLDNLAAGMSPEEIAASYPSVTPDDVRAAVSYAAELARERVIPLESSTH